MKDYITVIWRKILGLLEVVEACWAPPAKSDPTSGSIPCHQNSFSYVNFKESDTFIAVMLRHIALWYLFYLVGSCQLFGFWYPYNCTVN